MKKIVLLIAIISMVACSNNQPISDADAGMGAPVCTEASCPLHLAKISDTIQEDNWKFILPELGWTSVSSPDDTVKVVFADQELGTVVFLAKEPTKQTFPEYVINILRTLADMGVVISSTKQVSIDAKTFVLVAANDHDRKVWLWINVQKGNGYVFSCITNGEENNQTIFFDRCSEIANSIQIQ